MMATAEAFTSRQFQWKLVAAALAEHQRRIAEPGFDVEDLERPRDNVIVFHGVGGIGKATLSRKLEAALASTEQRLVQWGEPHWPGGRILPVRIDLSRTANTSFEDLVLTIRVALAELGHPLPAFDIALRRYWEIRHPGQSLECHLSHSGLALKFGTAVTEQMLPNVAQGLLMPGNIAHSTTGQLDDTLTRALRDRCRSFRALAGCAQLEDLLKVQPDLDALSLYLYLLAWEIDQLPADRRTVPVVLLDTFEDVGDRTHRDLERLIQRVIWLMPNAFFIITSRSRLQWADPSLRGQLDYIGPTAWPGLTPPVLGVSAARSGHPAPGRGRQVLVGNLSPEDCEDHLARRLTHNGQALIRAHVRQVITVRSHGLPLYLDLAVMRFLEICRTGRAPQPADFEHELPALITRTLADLTPDERHVLRCVSLFDSFNLTLAAAAAGLQHDAPALRLIRRPFVRENPVGLWPYRLHGHIRSTIRSADHEEDRWSPRDWEQAAGRALTALGAQWQAHTGRDRTLLVGCLRQGLALARDFGLDLGWLADAAWAYISDSMWEPLALPALQGIADVLETPADAIVELLAALARRQHEHCSITSSRLAAVTHAGLLPSDVHEMALYYLAEAQRDLGDFAASRSGMQIVADGGGRLAPAARRGLVHLSRLAGEFRMAHASAQSLGWSGRQYRVEGDILWPHGDMDRAAAAYAAARDQAEQHGIAGERATSQAQRALVLAFTDPDTADDELHLAEQYLAGLDLRAIGFTLRVAALVRDAGTLRSLDAGRALRAEIRDAGITAAEAALELALAFHHAVACENGKVRAVIRRLRELARTGAYAYYADIAHYMAGLPLPTSSAARWIDGEGQTRNRWHSLVAARRIQTGHTN
ncbi:ATP/GTP-binding protein [Streptomyces sp. NPDC059985]|uniref:ATP/GTP-binding protein n=1 Tax=Streptomyces sp. NPDC059985 TaxID=3347025 RepID=UPI0036D2037A